MGTPIASYHEERVADVIPDGFQLTPGVLLAIEGRESGHVHNVYFHCPCGCGGDLTLPVTDKDKGEAKHPHRWHYSRGPHGPTVEPSVRHLDGCKAHYNITDGKTVIHGDSGK